MLAIADYFLRAAIFALRSSSERTPSGSSYCNLSVGDVRPPIKIFWTSPLIRKQSIIKALAHFFGRSKEWNLMIDLYKAILNNDWLHICSQFYLAFLDIFKDKRASFTILPPRETTITNINLIKCRTIMTNRANLDRSSFSSILSFSSSSSFLYMSDDCSRSCLVKLEIRPSVSNIFREH